MAQATGGVGINRPTLKVGSQGVAVSELQAALKLLGYYTGSVDGVYGESTAIAVSQFQKAAGLNPDGVVSPETWERLFPLTPPIASSPSADPNGSVPNNSSDTNGKTLRRSVSTRVSSSPKNELPQASPANSASASTDLPIWRLGMRGSAVTKLQQRLQAAGLFKGNVDGVFGSETEAAVKAAQRRYSIKPDGVVGPTTWKVLP